MQENVCCSAAGGTVWKSAGPGLGEAHHQKVKSTREKVTYGYSTLKPHI